MAEKKILIKLKEGSYLDLFCHNQYIMSDMPYVAYSSHGIQYLISKGKATMLADLNEEANQEAFEKCWAEAKGNQKKAVELFLKEYSEKKKVEPAGGNTGGNTGKASNGDANAGDLNI